MPKSLSRLLSNVLIPQQPFSKPSATLVTDSNQPHTSNEQQLPSTSSRNPSREALELGEVTAATSSSRARTGSITKPPKAGGSAFRLHLGFHRSSGSSSHDIAKDAAPHDAGSAALPEAATPHRRRSGSIFSFHHSHAHSSTSSQQPLPPPTPLAVSTLGIVGINQRCNDYFYQHMLHLLIQAKQTSFKEEAVHIGPQQQQHHDNNHPPPSNTRSSLTSIGSTTPNERPSNTLTGLAASVLKTRSRQKPFKKHWFQNIVMTQQHPYYDEADKAEEQQQHTAAAAAAAASSTHCVPSTSADVASHPPSRNRAGYRTSEHEVHERRSDFMMPSVTQLQRLDGLLLLWDKHHHDQVEEPNVGTLAMPSVNQINVSLIENDEIANTPVILVVNMGLTQPRTSTQQRAYLEKVSELCWTKIIVEKLGSQRARVFLWWSDSDVKDAKKILQWLIDARKKTIKLLPNAEQQQEHKWKNALVSSLSTVSSRSSGSSINSTNSRPATTSDHDNSNIQEQQQNLQSQTSSRRHLYDVVLPPISSSTLIAESDQNRRTTENLDDFNTSPVAVGTLFSTPAQASCSDDNVIHQQHHHLPPLPNSIEFDAPDNSSSSNNHGRRSAYPAPPQQQLSVQITRAPVFRRSLSDDCIIRPEKNKRFIAKIRNWRLNDRRKYSSTHTSQVVAGAGSNNNNSRGGENNQSKTRQQSGGPMLTSRNDGSELIADSLPSQRRGEAVVAFRYGSESHTDFSTSMPPRHRIAGSQQVLSRLGNNSNAALSNGNANNNNVIGGCDTLVNGGAAVESRPAIERRNTVLRQRRQVRRQARSRVQEALERARRPMLERRQHLVAAGIVSSDTPLPSLELTMLAHLTPVINERDGRVSRARCTFEDTFTGMLYEIAVAFSQGLTLGEFAEVRNQMAELMSSPRFSGAAGGGRHHQHHHHHHHHHAAGVPHPPNAHDSAVVPHSSHNGNTAPAATANQPAS